MASLPKISIFCVAIFLTSPLLAHEWASGRPDAHAPISVMGDHTHNAGEVMFSYRHMRMEMNDLMEGDDAVPAGDLLGSSDYMMAPTRMTMEMDMFGLMYAPTDKTTILVMLEYLESKMDMLVSMPSSGMMGDTTQDTMVRPALMLAPTKATMKSSGIGDVKMGLLHNLHDAGGQRLHLNFMLSLPTGSIDEEGSNNRRLPYRMQLGSGTYDFIPGITYVAQYDAFSWGAQAQAVFRADENEENYRLGNRYQAQAWIQMPVHRRIAVSARMEYDNWRNINGQDAKLQRGMTPLADPALQGGNQVTAGFGVSATLPAGNRLAIEYSKVLRQNLKGPQMAEDDAVTLAWQLSFD